MKPGITRRRLITAAVGFAAGVLLMPGTSAGTLSCCAAVVGDEGRKEAEAVYNYSIVDGKAVKVTQPGAKASLSFVEAIYEYKTIGDKPLRAYVYKRTGEAVRPVIISLHPGALMVGGAQKTLVRDGKPVQGAAKFIEQGYAIVSIEYRLAPDAKLPQIVEDLRDAYQWVHDKGPRLLQIDPKRIGVMGTSAGGYLTLMSGYCVSPRPRVLVSVSGYGDIIGDWYAKPDPFYRQKPLVTERQAKRPNAGAELYLYCRQNGLWPSVVTGHDPATEPEWFKPYCPVRNITREYPPKFLLHGDQDTDVPYQESVEMDKELTAKGVEHEFILNRGAGHGVSAFGGNSMMFNKVYDRLMAFVNKQMK